MRVAAHIVCRACNAAMLVSHVRQQVTEPTCVSCGQPLDAWRLDQLEAQASVIGSMIANFDKSKDTTAKSP